jgi:transposase
LGQLRWLHKVRLYPTCRQERGLVEMLRVTRELYNALLQQRQDVWTSRRVAIGHKAQYRQITELRSAEPRFASINRECEDAVLRRLDLSFAAFFRRLKRGDVPGYPRFKPASRWSQLEFPHGERLRLDDPQQRLLVPGVGDRFVCIACGHEADADVNAACIILLRTESPPMRAPRLAQGRSQDAACPRPRRKSNHHSKRAPDYDGGRIAMRRNGVR